MSGGDGQRSTGSTVRALRRELAEAAEIKIAQIVAMVDALPARGDADALIAPLRPRLAQLRLPRPLSLGRLLFMPLQPVLVDGPAWRRGAPIVPRTACLPLIALVRAGLDAAGPGEGAPALDARLAGQTTANTALATTEGRVLWPRAAAILRAAPRPADWQTQTGLADTDYPTVARMVRLVLSQAVWLQEAARGAVASPNDLAGAVAALTEIVREGGGGAEVACAGLIAVILASESEPELRLDLIESEAEPPVRAAIRRARALAMTHSLDRLESGATLAGTLEQAAGSVRRDAQLLDALDQHARQDTERRARVQEVRRTLDEQCRNRFRAAIETDLALPPASAGVLDDGSVMELEQAARALHRFERSARRIGGRDFYDAALRSVADQLARPEASALTGIDRVRLTELLLGADRAMTLLRSLG